MKGLFVYRFAILVLAIVLLPAVASAQQGVIEGTVRSETAQPIPGATVKLEDTKLGTIVRPNGRFVLRNIEPGVYTVSVSAIGFRTQSKTDVVVGAGKSSIIDFTMQSQVITGATVVVESGLFEPQVESITSVQSLSAEETRRAPGAQEDVLRTVAVLPGVSSTQPGRNDLAVRGGAPYENLFLVDGIQVANINHFGSQGASGGPLTLINIEFVDKTAFASGGFSTKYGDRLSSVTDIRLREGSRERLSGTLNLSATGFGAIAEGPIGEDASYLVSVRRSYLDLLFELAGFSFVPSYWDAQTKVNWDIDDNNSLSFLFVGALDKVSLNNEDEDNRYDNSRVASPSQDQYFSGMTWKHIFEDALLESTFGRTYNKYSVFQNDSLGNRIFGNESREGEISLRNELTLFNDGYTLLLGNQIRYSTTLDFDVQVPGFIRTDEFGAPQALSVDTSFNALNNATYAELSANIFADLEAVVGLRADYYDYGAGGMYVSPRASLKWQYSPTGSVSVSAGQYVQAPSYIWLIGGPNNDELSPMQSQQVVLSSSRLLSEDVKLQAEVFYKKYDDYPARIYRPQAVLAPSGFEDVTTDIPFGLEPISNMGEGTSYGLEIFLQKKPGDIPLFGLVSLTLSHSVFTSIEGKERVGAYDQPVIANILGGYRPADDWEVSAKFRVASGLPQTPYTSEGQLDFERYNEGERLPVFHALDVRVDKKFSFSSWQLRAYLDIQNIYNRNNITSAKWNQRTQEVEENESIGLLPSIGVNIEF